MHGTRVWRALEMYSKLLTESEDHRSFLISLSLSPCEPSQQATHRSHATCYLSLFISNFSSCTATWMLTRGGHCPSIHNTLVVAKSESVRTVTNPFVHVHCLLKTQVSYISTNNGHKHVPPLDLSTPMSTARFNFYIVRS